MYTINDLPSWYDHWKTGGYGEDDRESSDTEPEDNTVRCDICYKKINILDAIPVNGRFWCEDCYMN